MFGMSKMPPYRAAGERDASESAGMAAIGGAVGRSGYRGHEQLLCPTVLWGWLFPRSPNYRTATGSSVALESDVVTEDLELDAAAPPCAEEEQGPRVVESNGPVTVVIRRSE